MKRRRSPERQQADQPRRLSESEVEEMVSRKVRAVLKNQDSTLQALQQKLSETEVSNFEDRIKKLKAHIQKVKRRGDAAIAYVKLLNGKGKMIPARQNTATGAVTSSRNLVSGDDSSDCAEVISGDVGSRRQPVEGFWQGRRARVQVVDLTSDHMFAESTEQSRNASAQTDNTCSMIQEKCRVSSSVQPEIPSSSDSPPCHISTPQCTLKDDPTSLLPTVKEEPPPSPVAKKIKMEEATHDPPSPVSLPQPTEDDRTPPPIKEEPESPEAITVLVKTEEMPQVKQEKTEDDWETKLHPLPDTPSPDFLPFDATTKNAPQKLTFIVKRRDTGEKPGIYAKVELDQVDRHGAQMDSYYVYGSQESIDGIFSPWQLIGHLQAAPLPMFFQLTSRDDSNHRLFFTIVGKDKYGRYGPYSDIEFVYANSEKPS